MSSYNWKLQSVLPADSILASIATPVSVLLIPLGFGVWQMAAAAITGFIAKEEVVGTLAAVFVVSENIIGGDFQLLEGEAFVESIAASGVELTAVAALSYLMFNLFTPPCFAAIGAMNSEIKSRRWFFAGLGIQLSVAYVLSFAVYQAGTLLVYGKTGTAFMPGLIAVALIIFTVFALGLRSNLKVKKEYESKRKLKVSEIKQ